ncbi:MAG TPA: TonB-dependent receptor, partial [Prevotella sp.]|nr:TonB-dependent receptor [Prevotella sp.]
MKQKNLKLAVMALCSASLAQAQNPTDSIGQRNAALSESAFTFTEAQLGEDDDMSQNVTIVNSNNNIYASEVGYLFSPVRFRYRAFDQKYNDVYVNGVPMNDMETGQFRFSNVGGLNQQTKNQEFALPFESNNFAMPGMAGSNNYNFRPASMPAGHRITLTGANRSYTLRGMYTFNTGLSNRGWAFSGNVTYRWANEGYVEGTFYNSLSYFLGVQKVFGDGTHSLSLTTWGNPTERASQGAGTDEMYWMANDRYYNPYWGYQNGKKRNSRIVNDFAPTALLTWDWKISDNDKLTTSVLGRYSMYKSTKLNYNNADNPHPNYWKNMPSSYYDIWDETNTSYRNSAALANWQEAYDYWSGAKANRQIDWDRLYYCNKQAAAQGQDAMYYIQAKHNNALNIALSSTFNKQIDKDKTWNIGIIGATNKGMHYQTMEDMLGANLFHNINNYVVGTNYTATSPGAQYDLNNPNGVVKEGDRFGYDYNILVDKANVWTTYAVDVEAVHAFVSGRVAGTQMQRDGKMRNGLAADNSYGKSGKAHFLDGGFKVGANMDLGRGNTLGLGLGYEVRTPTPSTAFASPEINNDFVANLHNEKVRSFELGYQLRTSWLAASLSAYYSDITDGTEWQCFYFDAPSTTTQSSFSYVSMTDVQKEYYGIEYGLNFKLSSAFNLKFIGTLSEAKYMDDPTVIYMMSNTGEYSKAQTAYMKNVHESGTPLSAHSIGLSFHQGGWYIDLAGNYYDRIYLSPSVYHRYEENCHGQYQEQTKGDGGFMLDGSIGKSIYLKHGSLSINLTVS